MVTPKFKRPVVNLPNKQSPTVTNRQAVPATNAVMDLSDIEPERLGGLGGACASVLLSGGSGTGKSYAIERLASTLNIIYVAVEPKFQQIRKYDPLIIQICKPVEVARKKRLPTWQEKWDRLLKFKNAIAEGMFREWKGDSIDVICIEGLMEIGEIIHRVKKATYSRQSSFIMWEEIGLETIDYVKALRDAAGVVAPALGFKPIPVIITVGEKAKEKNDMPWFEYKLPGNMAADSVPYAFEQIIRLDSRTDTGGGKEFVFHCQKGDAFFAKMPEGFPSAVVGQGVKTDGQPDFLKVYRQLERYYAGEEIDTAELT